MKQKFTQGEWFIDDSYTTMMQINSKDNLSGSEFGVCEVDCSNSRDGFNEFKTNPTEEEEANAHLIAAAPKMYRMLEALLADDNIDDPSIDLKVKQLIAEARGELIP